MQEYILTVSKYVLPLCMAFYTFESFFALSYKKESERNFSYIRQSFWLFIIQLICFVDVALVTRDKQYIIAYAFVQLFLFSVLLIPVLVYPKVNRQLLNNMAMLMGIGLATLSRLSLSRSLRQYIIMVVSFVICMFIPYMIENWKIFHKLSWFYATLGILLLSVVLILGEVTKGSKISFTVYNITFQPSEFVKIVFIFFMAACLYEETSLLRVFTTSAIAGIHVIVLVLSKDLGSALIFFVAYLAILFVATRNYLYLFGCLFAGAAASVVAYKLFSHIRVRVLAWQDPWAYIDSKGYQITQSLFAIGSGSWFGMGLGSGNPDDIPLVEADFIFSSICEEFGTIFSMCLVLVILSCFMMMMDIAVRQRNNFYRLIALGIGIVYIFQIFLTIGGGIKFIPLTGVTLPFISYGGSSVLTTMAMFFILQGISIMNRKDGEKRRVRRKRRPVKRQRIESTVAETENDADEADGQ